jgi:hypothetical protein
MKTNSIEVKSGFVKVKQNQTDGVKPVDMQFKVTGVKEGFKENDVIEDATLLYLKTNFPNLKFKIITDPAELKKSEIAFKKFMDKKAK